MLISAVKSFKLEKLNQLQILPKHNRKYSTITLDANKQTRILKSGEIIKQFRWWI